MLKGDSFLEKDGQTILLDSDAVQSLMNVFRDCDSREGSRPGTFRMSKVHAPYVKASLDALDGVDVEAPPSWRTMAEQFNGMGQVTAVALPDGFVAVSTTV